MLKKCVLPIIFTIIALVLSACSSGINLFNDKGIEYFSLSDGQIGVRFRETQQIEDFVNKYQDLDINTDQLKAQDRGQKFIGDIVFYVEVVYEKGKSEKFWFCEYVNGDKVEYYFQRKINDRYYITKSLSVADHDYLDELLYGDIIELD